MEKDVNINIDDFMSLFIAVSFLQEQRIINVENVKHYLELTYNLDKDTLVWYDNSIQEMIDAGMVSRIPGFNNVLKISKKIPFKEIIYDKYDYLKEMIDFFYNYNNYYFENMIDKEMPIIKK